MYPPNMSGDTSNSCNRKRAQARVTSRRNPFGREAALCRPLAQRSRAQCCQEEVNRASSVQNSACCTKIQLTSLGKVAAARKAKSAAAEPASPRLEELAALAELKQTKAAAESAEWMAKAGAWALFQCRRRMLDATRPQAPQFQLNLMTGRQQPQPQQPLPPSGASQGPGTNGGGGKWHGVSTPRHTNVYFWNEDTDETSWRHRRTRDSIGSLSAVRMGRSTFEPRDG